MESVMTGAGGPGVQALCFMEKARFSGLIRHGCAAGSLPADGKNAEKQRKNLAFGLLIYCTFIAFITVVC